MCSFGCWFLYINFKISEVYHVGELISRCVNWSVYPAIQREICHAGPFVAWKHGVTSATLESCQAEISEYLATKKTH